VKLGSAIGKLLLTAVLVAGCEFFNSDRTLGENIVLQNGTSETIEILNVIDSVEWTIATIEPGQGYRIRAAQFTDGCLTGPFVAKDEDGTVVARRDGELCSGDTWEVTAQAVPSES
jgi:hypothetical protein